MAFADKKGIVVASPFKLQAESMLDVRQQVDTLTERNELVTIKAATAGLRVYVKETKKSYVYNGTTWDELSIGNASLVVTLNGGTSEGTNKFTYNGTAAKTVNITADGIGAASKTHNHTKSQITDFPTSMKNPQALKFTGGATATYDGSEAVTVNIPTTAITSRSLIVTLNGGTTEGTNKFTFNGSAEKNINITPSTIGAAAATHTHNVNQITGLTTGRALVSDANGHPSVSSTTATELSYLHGVTSSVQTQLNNKAALNHTHNYAGSSSAGGAANSAVKLQTARKLNGVSFDGSADINIPNNYFASMVEEDLNKKVDFGEYYGAGGNGCKNLPSGVDWFYLRVFRTADGYVGQNLYANGTWYSRYKNGTSWTSWSEQYSSTNKPTPSEIGAAASSHTHTASQITGLPTSLKNPYAITFTGAATGTYDGSRAVTINIPTTGATTKASLVIQLNGGTTEGDDKFTFNGGTTKTVNITPASIGAAAASHGTHVTYSTTAPKANGTASAGTAASVSRSDHVHPAQTTVSGNAGSATKLQTKRNIDGVQFDGSANIIHFGSCSTAAGTAAKVVSCTGFVLASGSRITVKFTTTNTAANPTLNVNSTGAKAIKYRGSTISAGYLAAGRVYTFIYDGTNYELVGDINTDTNTTYNTGTATTAGLTKLYTATGSGTDGTMTQKAITAALSGKAASSHTHTSSSISDFDEAVTALLPSKLPNPYAVTFTGAATGTYDGSRAVTINIPTTGATSKESLVIQLNGGTTEGDDKFTFNGGTAKTVNITPASIGAAAASHGTHVTYGTSAPKANGTASAGTANSVSRSDHVHPLQTTVSGNAGSATKLQTKRNIDGVQFDGSASITHFGSCSTAAGTAAKVVSCTGFVLETGARITVKFTVTNTAASPTLNVNGTGAKAIKYRGSTISTGYLAANRVYTFIYDGTDYELVGDINTDTNTTYNTGTASTAGLTKLYTTTGSAADGTMTQKAITDALSGKAASSHTHGVASTTANGFLKQLDGSKSHFMRGDGTWATPPNTTYSAFKAATSSAAGGTGLVPAPAAGAQSKFLRGDATWQAISLSTLGVTATATELNYMDGVKSNVQTQLNGKAASSHTHNYAGSSSAGGAANSAVKLTTARTINGTSFDGTKNITLSAMHAEDLSNKNVSLNTYNLSSGTPKVKYYYCPTNGAGDGITGRPDDTMKNAFFLICESVRFASATDYITKQTYIYGVSKTTWERYCTNGTWSAWGEIYTSQNKPTASEIGAASSSHTHNYAGSSSAGGAANSVKSALTIQFNGTTKATFNGSAAATVNITPSAIGAAAASHTHNYAGSSSAGGAANSVKTSLTVRLNGGNTEGTNKFTFNGSAAKTINITPSSIGAAAASHGTHVTYSTTAPKANGTASAGSAASVSRSDHVHPLQTTVSGNAGSATKLQTKRNIDGVQFDGSASITHFGSCSTAAATAAKVVSCTGFVLGTGARITVKFTVTNTAASPTLNVNGTGAKAIKYRGSTINAGYLAANRVYTFIYDGTDYELVGDINTDTDTTYSTGTTTTAGLTRLYTSTGSATNGTMTQKAITDALAGKSSSSHTHNYAGSSSAGGAANSANKINGIGLTNQNLNNYHTGVNFYYGAGGNSCTSKPSGIDNFGMFVFQSAGGWWTQVLYGSDDNMYTRRYVNSSWTSWSKIYSTTNKPTASAIGAAAASHTHKYAGSSSAGGAANSANRVPVPVGTVLFSTSSSTTFFNSCFGGTWEIVGNIDAIVGNGTTLTLYMFRKTKA